jgi:hypothetical protein
MWLFAYFPGIGVSGVGCLWRRGEEIDAWTEKEWWHFARGDGPIAADWIGGNRQVKSFVTALFDRIEHLSSGSRTPLGQPSVYP